MFQRTYKSEFRNAHNDEISRGANGFYVDDFVAMGVCFLKCPLKLMEFLIPYVVVSKGIN